MSDQPGSDRDAMHAFVRMRNIQNRTFKRARALEEENVRLREQIAALQAFKDYVHSRLDEAAVPTHPEGHHSKAGCRIGDRLDLILKGWK
jgi:phage shock protein A